MLKSVREQERSPEGPGDVALSVCVVFRAVGGWITFCIEKLGG